MAMNGLKVFTTFTDLGNTGLNGMRAYAALHKKLPEFDANHRYVVLTSDNVDALEEVLQNPCDTIEGFADYNPDVWADDGFGFYVKNSIVPEAEDLYNQDAKAAKENFSGSNTQQAWGHVKNKIVRVVDKMTSWQLPSNKAITRIFTCGVRYVPVPDQEVRATGINDKATKSIASKEPDIPTSAKHILKYAFDLGIYTSKDKNKYFYTVMGDYMKKRYVLPETPLEADFIKNIWTPIQNQR